MSVGLPEEVIKLLMRAINPGHKQLLARRLIFNSSMQMIYKSNGRRVINEMIRGGNHWF